MTFWRMEFAVEISIESEQVLNPAFGPEKGFQRAGGIAGVMWQLEISFNLGQPGSMNDGNGDSILLLESLHR